MALEVGPPPSSTTTTDDDEHEQQASASQPQEQQSSTSGIGCARYPNPLGSLLQDCAASRNPTIKESPVTALENLVGNAIQALDQWYFTALPKQRNAVQTAHRTCLRVSTTSHSVTITDLGIGMTRADLINLLGVGRPQMQRTTRTTSTVSTATTSDEDDNATYNNNDDSVVGVEGDDTNDEDTSRMMQPQIPRCKTNDIGGFYAAICTLAVGVKVGTKSKFDDYYEFQLGQCGDSSGNWNEFVITRPMDEGAIPSVDNGMTQLTDVRGDSGTSVTIYLQPIHYHLTQTEVLLPILTHCLETTQYTVAIAGLGTPNDEQDIIQASEREAEWIVLMLSQDTVPITQDEDDVDVDNDVGVDNTTAAASSKIDSSYDQHHSVHERAKYIPLRLSLAERKLLRLVVAAMNCCDYTTRVDNASIKSPTRRLHQELKGVMSVLRGLITACDYEAGKKLGQTSGNYDEYLPFLRQVLEVARRHKIMNPSNMRTEYGKLIYLLQDLVRLQADGHLDGVFGGSNNNNDSSSLIAPIQTVYTFLEQRQGLDMLQDKWITVATEEILALGKSRTHIDAEIRRKERAVAQLKKTYQSPLLSPEHIHLCLYSICDNNSFLNSNRVPIDTIISFLETHFSPTDSSSSSNSNSHQHDQQQQYSLAIIKGQEGSRLSHSHERQYSFALQSLTLWRDIVNDMFRLWAMAESDLLSEGIAYKLQDTGQGMQRVQQSPLTYKAMQEILVRVQTKVQHWVGSSVIHLGDHNVPNALSFIDKYTQVPRILSPIVACLENLEKLCEEDYGIQDMIEDGFGGLHKLRKDILYDFFRSAFDGSGANNFYDAGSCIDGRLTSAWNWCSQLPNKPFYPIFKLTGFTGFDGEFK